ncbi:hypothetical protein RUM44_009353 [Polyplax serrata]|uniref:Uncharacterized protein n=1 Tax=Polyplax serrata TaxID=468196 RepID=A0ABR1ASI4_POLSC
MEELARNSTSLVGVRKSSVCLYVLRLVLPYHYKAHCCHINLRSVEEEEQGRIPEVPGQLANTQVPRSELISDDESIEIDPGILGDQIPREDMLAGKTKKKQAGSGEGRGFPPEEEEGVLEELNLLIILITPQSSGLPNQLTNPTTVGLDESEHPVPVL